MLVATPNRICPGGGRSARRWIVAFLTVMVAASGCEVVHHDAAEALPKFTRDGQEWNQPWNSTSYHARAGQQDTIVSQCSNISRSLPGQADFSVKLELVKDEPWYLPDEEFARSPWLPCHAAAIEDQRWVVKDLVESDYHFYLYQGWDWGNWFHLTTSYP